MYCCHRILCSIHIFIAITHAQILYQCNFDTNTIATSCLKPESFSGLLIDERTGIADIQPPTAPLSDVTSSLKPTSNGESCNLPYKLNSFTWDMYFCNEGYCQTSTDSTSKCSPGKFGHFDFQGPRKVSFTLNTASGGADGTDDQCLIYYYYLSNVSETEQSITIRKQEVGDSSETMDIVTSSSYNGWIKRQVSFHTSKSGYKIYLDFEKISGSNILRTIIGIDEISVLQGNCRMFKDIKNDSISVNFVSASEPTTQSTSTISIGTTTPITTITKSDLITVGITSISTEPITTATTTITTTTTSTTTTTTTSSTTTTTSTGTITSTATTTAITTITTSTTTTTTATSIKTTTSTISTSSTAKTTTVTISTTTTSLSTHLIITTTTTVMTNQPSPTTIIASSISNSTVSTTPSSKVYIIVLATVIPIGTVAIVILILWIKKPMPFKKSKVNVFEMNQVTPAPI
ncbi:unnamed protein product [Adineta steineri]|uniref:MAM domain-containing protein n=1 Tax=Adineta steineri TaxID=433720 RepID=A0A818ZP61_9BILA|nr:unnamed protein product [Adineta steineri]CAF3767568.1 unnamed protein product [Adineta steineri]